MEILLMFISLLYHCNFRILEGSLISQSNIEFCSKGDTSEPERENGQICKKKIVISMTLGSGQAETEALYANINNVYNLDTKQPEVLKKPFRIELRKSIVVANYRVYYIGSANAMPTEEAILFSHGVCVDDWFSGTRNTCGRYRDKDGNAVWDSQGFCCECPKDQRILLARANNAFCEPLFVHNHIFTITDPETGNVYYFRSSAHCMNFSKLWYDVFEVESPNLHFSIDVNLKKLEITEVNKKTKETVLTWQTVSNFSLSPDMTIGRTHDGSVVAEVQGSLLGSRGLQDLSTKRLLIPSLRAWHEDYLPEEYRNGPTDWLLVDEHLVDLSGNECNKVGVSFSGFRNQIGKCFQHQNSCFTNQPSQFWKADDLRRKRGVKGFYMLQNYGRLHPSTHVNNNSFIMRLIYPELHNSFVTFRIDASNVSLVVNAGKGRIVTAESRGFNSSTATAGEVIVVVENLGEVTQEFNVVLNKCFGRTDLPSKRVTILPASVETVVFPLLGRNTERVTVNCEVQLFDQRFTLLGTARLTFSSAAPCFCFGICDCTCDEKTGKVTEKACPTPPPIYVDTRSVVVKILIYVLEFLGLHTFVAFFGTLLLCLGMVKLCCGGVFSCKKSAAQTEYDDMKKKGRIPNATMPVRCSGQCRGALAAKARIKRKAKRMRKMGRDPKYLDDWVNTSFECTCNYELSEIRYIYIIKALCFYYYLLILPFIWLGKKVWWGIFVDTYDKKRKAETAVRKAAVRSGPESMKKVGVVSIEDELKKVQKQYKKHEEKQKVERQMKADAARRK